VGWCNQGPSVGMGRGGHQVIEVDETRGRATTTGSRPSQPSARTARERGRVRAWSSAEMPIRREGRWRAAELGPMVRDRPPGAPVTLGTRHAGRFALPAQRDIVRKSTAPRRAERERHPSETGTRIRLLIPRPARGGEQRPKPAPRATSGGREPITWHRHPDRGSRRGRARGAGREGAQRGLVQPSTSAISRDSASPSRPGPPTGTRRRGRRPTGSATSIPFLGSLPSMLRLCMREENSRTIEISWRRARTRGDVGGHVRGRTAANDRRNAPIWSRRYWSRTRRSGDHPTCGHPGRRDSQGGGARCHDPERDGGPWGGAVGRVVGAAHGCPRGGRWEAQADRDRRRSARPRFAIVTS